MQIPISFPFCLPVLSPCSYHGLALIFEVGFDVFVYEGDSMNAVMINVPIQLLAIYHLSGFHRA